MSKSSASKKSNVVGSVSQNGKKVADVIHIATFKNRTEVKKPTKKAKQVKKTTKKPTKKAKAKKHNPVGVTFSKKEGATAEITRLRREVAKWMEEFRVTEEARASFEKAYYDLKKPGVTLTEAVGANGNVVSLKPVPPKKQLLQAVTVLAHRLVKTDDKDFETVGKATLTDLVGDLRRHDLLTRKEATKLNKRYSLGLVL